MIEMTKWNESGFRPPLCTYRLNWARRTSWGWWDDWDDTVLQTQDSKFEPWRSEAEHATIIWDTLNTIHPRQKRISAITIRTFWSLLQSCVWERERVVPHTLYVGYTWNSFFFTIQRKKPKKLVWCTVSIPGQWWYNVGSPSSTLDQH